jgi:hypothetical protein
MTEDYDLLCAKVKFMIVESKYSEDDFKVVPEEMQEKIRSVILEKLQPAILAYIKKFEDFKLRGIAAEQISYENLCSYHGSLEPAFEKKQQYDLYLMRYFCLPEELYVKVAGKQSVGAAIRISEWIGKQEHANELKGIVRDFYTPEDLQVPKCLDPYYLSLNSEFLNDGLL